MEMTIFYNSHEIVLCGNVIFDSFNVDVFG